MTVLVGTHQADEDYVTLLPLEAVDRIDRNRGAEGLEEGIAPEQLAEVLHLCLVGGNQSYIDALFEETFLADAVDVGYWLMESSASGLLMRP